MKVTADDQQRVVLPVAKPGDCFEVEVPQDGTVILTRLEPAPPAKAKLKRSNGRTLLVSERPITPEDVHRAMETFPRAPTSGRTTDFYLANLAAHHG